MLNNPSPLTSYFSPLRQEAMEIAERIFHLTDNLPKKEDYGFTSTSTATSNFSKELSHLVGYYCRSNGPHPFSSLNGIRGLALNENN